MEIGGKIGNVQVQSFLKNHFGIEGQVKKLVGEMDLNYYVQSTNGEEYIFKIPHESRSLDEIEFQITLINHLNENLIEKLCPKVVVNQNGLPISPFQLDELSVLHTYLLSWIPGTLLVDYKPHSPQLLSQIGQQVAKLNKALRNYNHPHAKRTFKWDLAQANWIKSHLQLLNEEQNDLVSYFLDQFEKNVLSKSGLLPRQVVYNDANDYNILVEGQSDQENYKISFIDFGDAVHSWRINDLAICCTYLMLDKIEPLAASLAIVKAYNLQDNLEEIELECLYNLIGMRLCISLVNAAINKIEEPDNEYLFVTEKPGWELLTKWRELDAKLAHASFINACGHEAFLIRKNYNKIVDNINCHPLIKLMENDENPYELDLSIGSTDLGNNSNFSSIEKFSQTIDRILIEKDRKYAIGGYGEARPFYTTDNYLFHGNQGPKWRTIHLGLDVWSPPGTAVCCPLNGRIHSFKNNEGKADYGPTIILEHEPEPGFMFYTLYGHLSMSSLSGLQIGQEIQKGSSFCQIGPPPENGNWPPHLHFQVMLDMLDMEGNFPGVAYPDEWEVWKSLCPDPFVLLGLTTKTEEESSGDQDIELRKEILGRSLSLSYKTPLKIVRGFGQYLYDESGRRYLDTVNNVAHVGHEHPQVVQAGQNQMALLNTNTRYLHQNILNYAEELLATFPEELSVVHFVNSGSEANELAIRMAKTISRSEEILAIEMAYHGNTGAAVDVSSYKFDRKGGRGCPAHTHIVPMPDPYRGKHSGQKTGATYAYYVSEKIRDLKMDGKNPAGFIHESILSCGGQIVLPDNYLKLAYNAVREAGGLCIADEVQVGFGRVGSHFWAFEMQGVIPDIVTLGKPIGNGHPLGAVVCTAEVADAFANGMEYFNTFGGNPVSCAIGHEVLKVIKEEKLQENALEVGHYLRAELLKLQKDFKIIGDVRGLGLFQGFELINNHEEMIPASSEAAYLVNRMRDYGILMSTDGPDNNVIKIKPPLVFEKTNVDMMIRYLRKVLQENFMN